MTKRRVQQREKTDFVLCVLVLAGMHMSVNERVSVLNLGLSFLLKYQS